MMASTMRSRLTGGAVLGAVALAFYLGMNFKGPGLGGTGEGVGTPSATTGAEAETPPVESEIVGDDAPASASTEASTAPAELLTVILGDSEYRVTTNSNMIDARPSSLGQVVQAASLTTGDGQGIRVRIYKTKLARAGMLKDLQTRLAEAGINPGAIQIMDDFIP